MQIEFLKRAIALAQESVSKGGGPFGAVIVKDGKIISEASNSVTQDLDPSAHAEVNAIRKACKAIGSYDLTGADIYCSCEPCPMCLGTIYWAHLKNIYFAANRKDAKDAGFDDDFIYVEFAKKLCDRSIPTEHVEISDSTEPFALWAKKVDKKAY